MLGWLHTASRVCQNLCFAYSLPVLVDYIDDSEQILDICSALAAECQISQLEKVKKCFFFPAIHLSKCIFKETTMLYGRELL